MLKLDDQFRKLADVETPTCRSTVLEENILSQGDKSLVSSIVYKSFVTDSSHPINSTRIGGESLPPPSIEVSRIAGEFTQPLEVGTSEALVTSSQMSGTDVSSSFLRCECGKICQRKEGLKRHKQTCSVSEAPVDFTQSIVFTCSLCGTPCTTSRSLKQHTGSGKCVQRQAARAKSVSLTLALNESDGQIKEVSSCFLSDRYSQHDILRLVIPCLVHLQKLLNLQSLYNI